MMVTFHFLRPWWLLALLPLLLLVVLLWKQRPVLHAWAQICDSHLLEHLQQQQFASSRVSALLSLFLSGLFMIIALAGPAWEKLPVPSYKPVFPHVLVLDMSEAMLGKDLSPDRLSRAKFKLHDLFAHKGVGQFGLIAFTGEPFVVSPLTDDGQTISALLPMLTPDIMPVSGHNLDLAMAEAGKLIQDAGYNYGQILVLTADSPTAEAIASAKSLAAKNIFSSIMPMTADTRINPLFQNFADVGKGQMLRYSADSTDLQQWLDTSAKGTELTISTLDDIPLWRDEGRWFLIPALLLFMPVFRRGWLQRVEV